MKYDKKTLEKFYPYCFTQTYERLTKENRRISFKSVGLPPPPGPYGVPATPLPPPPPGPYGVPATPLPPPPSTPR